jgi:hypothetical protein
MIAFFVVGAGKRGLVPAIALLKIKKPTENRLAFAPPSGLEPPR